MSAAAIRYSTRCDFSEPVIARSAQVRFSRPQVASVGAQKPGMSRVYEFTVQATIASSSGIKACWPPIHQRMTSEMPFGLLGSWNTPLPFSVSEQWMWPDWPDQLRDHLA